MPSFTLERTAIIPAAGLGTRLGSSEPKLFYPILGKPLYHWCLQLLAAHCQHFVFVVAPAVEQVLQKKLDSLYPGRCSCVVQSQANGMGQAVLLGLEKVKTLHCLVMWVDQIALSVNTIQKTILLQNQSPTANLVLPTMRRRQPYISFVRNASGHLERVLQAREGDLMPDEGENDCGLFLFKTEALRTAFQQTPRNTLLGAKTAEINFLPILPTLDQKPGDVITVSISDPDESIGVNTPAEAKRLETLLKERTVR